MIEEQLYQALLTLKTPQEVKKFFKDLCTPKEIKDMSERFNIAKVLNSTNLSYQQIHAQTGVSIATIGRVARFLNQEPHQGYKIALERLANAKNDNN
ncbi:YerC/YecD family TrpR-related protein [Rickettsiales endosymbiont of Stachyamoeba lipophora]|uniref:YerC/YecD family TrpR-related protein n=1 Tax=Rickettsiales endosymbiont of Stachyamoeba lipophora TaxID=2486578 RepID=UPI000F6453BA|nr:YerC/YecD family TrpR-related protein [Rickettsiales endosymbiont of Stachyamoeba lipophora]AZL15288.1 hypothetical protein EF513_01790 [Rickettsiales endosymbiont of Stachyamoeba lipophora]